MSPLPPHWSRHLFKTLQANYGSAWVRMWAPDGNAESLVEAMDVWAEKLGPFARRPEAIKWALEHLPSEPPTLPAFYELCSKAPRAGENYLPLPAPEISNEEKQKRMESIEHWRRGRVDYTAWYRRILADPKRYPPISETLALQAKKAHGERKQGDPHTEDTD